MSKTVHIMIDCETLGLREDAVITQVGMVAFTSEFTIVEELEESFNFSPIVGLSEIGTSVDVKTLGWVFKNPELCAMYGRNVDAGVSYDDLARSVSVFIRDQKARTLDGNVLIWGNGVLADNLWIKTLLRSNGRQEGWTYKQDRDFRTLRAMFPVDEPEFEGMKHSALTDARHQVKILRLICEKYGFNLED